MDDVFFEDGAEKAISYNEMERLRESFTTLGLKEGIIDTKFSYDQDIVNQGFIEGYSSNLQRGYLGGRIDALQYLIVNLIKLDKDTEDRLVKKLTTIKQHLKDINMEWVQGELDRVSEEVSQN